MVDFAPQHRSAVREATLRLLTDPQTEAQKVSLSVAATAVARWRALRPDQRALPRS